MEPYKKWWNHLHPIRRWALSIKHEAMIIEIEATVVVGDNPDEVTKAMRTKVIQESVTKAIYDKEFSCCSLYELKAR